MAQILIVDDVPANIKILGELLKDRYQILVANNAEKALQIAAEKLPDLILMDVMMPGMDGYTGCKILKSQPKTRDIPLIFITALNEQEDIVKGFEAGGQDYISKPFNPAELSLRVQTHLELKSSRESLRRYALELEHKNRQLENAMEKLEKLATIDTLTNLANRRHMLENLHEEAARCQRHGRTFSVAIADIDQFKKINDTYGHNCGDQVLIDFAATLKENVRLSDMVSRWGGEEFLLLFPETELEGAKLACEKIREIVAGSVIRWEDRQIVVTATFGVSHSETGCDVNEVIKRADDALYQGKRAGRNLVVAL